MSVDLTLAPATDPTRIYRYRDGLYAVDLITAAVVELDFFSWLAAHPSSFADICAHFDLRPRPADVMLTLFRANGFVDLDRMTYRVTDLAREHLTTGSPWNLSPYYGSLKDRPVAQDFLRVLRSGKPAHWSSQPDALDWHAGMETDAFARTFTAAMDCRGRYLAQSLATRVDLTSRQLVLDIGGGSGIYACALAARHPHLTATVMEQEPVDAIARTLIAERGFANRVQVVTGNFLTDAFPEGADVHLFSNVLHDWDMPEVAHLLEASFHTLAVGGLLVIHEAFINAAKTGPLPVAEYSALLMHATQGKCYATSEYEVLLTDAGFEAFTYADTVADRGVMTALKKR